MYKIIKTIIVAVVIVLPLNCEKYEKTDEIDSELYYKQVPGYLVSLGYHFSQGENFKVIKNIETFDSIFIPNPYAENFIPVHEEDFNKNVGVAAICYYNSACEGHMGLDTVVFSNDTIKLFYNLEVDWGDGFMVCHSGFQDGVFIMTNKKNYSVIEYFRDSTLVKTLYHN